MKAAILTLPLHSNYGGILQAYALQHTLEQYGADVFVLQHKWKEDRTPTIICIKKTIRLFLKFLFKDHQTIILPKLYLRKNSKKFTKHLNRFIEKHVNTLQINDLTECLNHDFDIIVVGSDQIWRPQYFKKMWEKPIDYSYLSFISPDKKIKKIAYACSFGCDTWEYNESESSSCKSAIKDFTMITAREASGVELINSQFHCNASQVLDPTMLLTRQDYNRLINKSTSSSDYIFSYILDNNERVEKLVNRISLEKNLDIKSTRIVPVIKRGNQNKNIAIPIEEWLKSIRDAKLVITDSFHACVFSIIFNTPFIVMGNDKRGQSRFTSLLHTFGLENHLVNESDYNSTLEYKLPEQVQIRLESLRKESLNVLKHSLEC